MLIRKAFRFQLRLNPELEQKLRQVAGCVRFVWNKALALQQATHQETGNYLSYHQLAKQLTGWRNAEETKFLAAAPVHPEQQTLMDLEAAFGNFFAGRAGFPRFKKKGRDRKFRYPDPKQFQIAGDRIFLPKLGWVGFRRSRAIEGRPKNCTVSETAGRWYISIQTEIQIKDPVHPCSNSVGIDLGVKRLATLSDGSHLEPLHALRKQADRLAREQRNLSRKTKFSKNWQQQKQKIARLHATIADTRRDYLHKASTLISQNHAMVGMEDLQVRNLTASASGTKDEPGTKVAAKAGLNRAILDQGWSEFRSMLAYKLNWKGGQLVLVPPHHTSQQCSQCGHISPLNRQTQALFHCQNQACNYQGNADFNAARNILARAQELLAAGHAVSACGEHA